MKLSGNTVLMSTIGALAVTSLALTFTHHMLEQDREARANNFVTAHFTKVASQTPDPAIPDKEKRLKDILHFVGKYHSRQADYLVDSNVRLNLSASMQGPLFRIEPGAKVTLNAHYSQDEQKWAALNAAHYIRNKEKFRQAECFTPTLDRSALLPTPCN